MGTRPLSVLRLGLAWVALSVLRLTARRRGIVLVYHELAETAGDPRRDISAAHATAEVERQLRHLRRWYRIVGADEIVHAVRARRRGQRFPAAVTFDDDLRSHVDVALPLLERLGVRATFYLCGAALDRPFTFWWERLQRAVDVADPRLPEVLPAAVEKPLPAVAETVKRLSPDERDAVAAALAPPPDWESERRLAPADVTRLAAAMSVGFHTLRHDPLDRLADADLERALHDGRAALAAAGADLRQLAYPHGAADDRIAAAARRAGFTIGLAVGGAAVTGDTDDLLVPRVVPRHRPLPDFAVQLVRRLRAA
jgi:peptidoglycan/xylan/chitin deacetylase (PgdA/CDA1 family)